MSQHEEAWLSDSAPNVILGLLDTCQGVGVVFAWVLVGASLLCYVVLSLQMRTTRSRWQRPEPPAVETLPPAVVRLLLDGGTLKPSAVEETVLAMARDGKLRVARLDDGSVVALRDEGEALHAQEDEAEDEPSAASRGLRPDERLVLRRIEQRLGGQPMVPLAALGPGDGAEYNAWFTEFRRAVRAQALAAGLVWPENAEQENTVLKVSAGLIGAALLVLYLALGCSFLVSVALAVITVPVVLFTMYPLLFGPRLTPEGRQAARWWGENGERAAVSASAASTSTSSDAPGDGGLAGMLTAAPSERPPLESDEVWSSYGGHWRVVRVAPVSRPRWGWPSQLAIISVLFAVLTAGVALAVPDRGWDVPVSVAIPVLFWLWIFSGWLPAYRRTREIPEEETFDAAVVRRWTQDIHDRHGNVTGTRYVCAFDDGNSPVARSFGLRGETWGRLTVGDHVRIQTTSRRLRVTSLTVLEDERPQVA